MRSKKKISLLFIVILCLACFPGCGGGGKESGLVTDARDRVEVVLKNLLETRVDDFESEQLAICMWFSGQRHPLNLTVTLEVADNLFRDWKTEAGFQTIRSFTVDDAWIDDEADHPTVLVEGTINGNEFQMIVPDKQQINWHIIPRP